VDLQLARPVAIDTRQSQDGTVKNGLHRPRLSAIIISSRPPALILIVTVLIQIVAHRPQRVA